MVDYCVLEAANEYALNAQDGKSKRRDERVEIEKKELVVKWTSRRGETSCKDRRTVAARAGDDCYCWLRSLGRSICVVRCVAAPDSFAVLAVCVFVDFESGSCEHRTRSGNTISFALEHASASPNIHANKVTSLHLVRCAPSSIPQVL